MDRSIVLELRRKLPHEKIERIRHAEPDLFITISAKLARFAADNRERVRLARPSLPQSLNDRAQDNWEPLLAIAIIAGGDWLKIGTAAALKISGDNGSSQTIGTELVSDIRDIFDEKQLDRISTADLIKYLCADDEKSWATYNRGFPIKPRQLAKKLKGYDIHSKTIRTGYGETPKGFERKQFEETFLRYVATSPENIRNNDTTATSEGLSVADSLLQGMPETLNATPEAVSSADVALLRIETPYLEGNNDELPF